MSRPESGIELLNPRDGLGQNCFPHSLHRKVGLDTRFVPTPTCPTLMSSMTTSTQDRQPYTADI